MRVFDTMNWAYGNFVVVVVVAMHMEWIEFESYLENKNRNGAMFQRFVVVVFTIPHGCFKCVYTVRVFM